MVLLSAAPTGGPPRTRLVGSAFDPASVSVAVSPQRLKVASFVRQAPGEGSDDPDLLPFIGFAALPFPSLPLAPLAVHNPVAPPAVTVLPERILARPYAARAPPRA